MNMSKRKAVSGKNKRAKLPELLLPAGNVENFRAAVAGGADAIYLGLKIFNARGRAGNFTNNQLIAILEEIQHKNIEIYVTVNVVIKNKELPQLLDLLWFLSKTRISAVIIQDWGLYYLIKQYFPQLPIHASTQMGNHNSAGSIYSKKMGFERLVMARELTQKELASIQKKCDIELEYFIHGALCYSFSGMCLFSSYVGGMGANRGMCAQPCRRHYQDKSTQSYAFSLKDNQLISEIKTLSDMGIASLKVEGRMKSAEYVYTTAKSYREALDHNEKIPFSAENLKYDFGRDKTSYFFNNKVDNAITTNPNTGIFLGKIAKIENGYIHFSSSENLEDGNRIRLISAKTGEQINYKISGLEKQELGLEYAIAFQHKDLRQGDKIFLIGSYHQVKFSNKIKQADAMPSQQMPKGKSHSIIQRLQITQRRSRNSLFVRVDNPKWLVHIRMEQIDGLLLRFNYKTLIDFKFNLSVLQKNKEKVWIELPKFISESRLEGYSLLLSKLVKQGFKRFVLSHLSQQVILPKGSVWACNENVYVFNDAASKFLSTQACSFYCYPQEIDFDTLYSLKNRSGVMPLYFYPDLFYSRMPVKLKKDEFFKDDQGKEYKKIVRDGITIVRPKQAVSLIKYRSKMEKLGYKKFLLDFSDIEPSKQVFNGIMQAYNKSANMTNTGSFNLRRTLR